MQIWKLISIHTPTRGVTVSQFLYSSFSFISIHTPTRGVTSSTFSNIITLGHFNPHSHKGSDSFALFSVFTASDFNPHSHKGSDCYPGERVDKLLDFNPHSHKGSDSIGSYDWSAPFISIHTPTRGVTSISSRLDIIFSISIHTPTRGVTWKACWLTYCLKYFNPHSHKGSDSNISQKHL